MAEPAADAPRLGLADLRAIVTDGSELAKGSRIVDDGGLAHLARHQRKLFADDAVRGLAFVDVCRQEFDVVLMNPPFGDGSKQAKSYIEKAYPRTKNDLYAAFVECGLKRLLADGFLGAITSRTGFFLTSFKKWREEILLQEARPTVFADLGYGVLDSAMVETAAYCLVKCGGGS